ncbi:hypothetical protein PMAYCL1PPCAC_25265, partial [Pristionchus mayeri]
VAEDSEGMNVEELTPDQQAIFWEVKEWFPRASRAGIIGNIGIGLDALVNACADGTIPMDDEDDEMVERVKKLSLQPSEDVQVVQHFPAGLAEAHVLHVGEAAVAAGNAAVDGGLQPVQQKQPVAVAATSKPAAPAPVAQQPQIDIVECSICHKQTHPSACCHFPINKATGDLKEEDPRAHACCAKCITSRYMLRRIEITSRVAIACLDKKCFREIHQDRLVSDAQLKPAMVQWMLGNTDVTVGNARYANTVKELKRKREEEPEISDDECERLIVIIDHMDHDKFTYLVDLLSDVDFTWLLQNIDRGSVDAIIDRKVQDDTVPKRKRRRQDKKGITHLVEERLKMETTFDCAVCYEEVPNTLGVPCVRTGVSPSTHDQHLFCGACVRGHAAAAAEQASIVRAGLGLKCMQPDCAGMLIYAHIEPLLETRSREQLEEKIAAEALAAAAVNVERCQRCPFAAIVELPISEQQTFACRRCNFEYCRNCNREWSARHEGKTCEELNPEFIRRKAENALSDGAVGVLQRCPGCKVAFEKNGGCNNMHCKCGVSFPYDGVRVMSAEQRAAIIQQHVAEAAGDESVVQELNKIK